MSLLNETRWMERVKTAFHIIRTAQCTFDESLGIIDRQIYAELHRKYANGRKVYSRYFHGYVTALINFERANIWEHDVEFCFNVNGTLYTTSKKDTGKPKDKELYDAGQGHMLRYAPQKHYWIGTDKRYT